MSCRTSLMVLPFDVVCRIGAVMASSSAPIPQSASRNETHYGGGGQCRTRITAHYSLKVFHHRAGVVLAEVFSGHLDFVRGRMHGVGCGRGNAIAATVQCRGGALELSRCANSPLLKLVARFSPKIRYGLFYLGGFLADLLFYFARISCRVLSLC